MAKHWREMTPQEKVDQLRDEMMVKSNQISVLAKEIETLSQRLAVVEGKSKPARPEDGQNSTGERGV